MNLKKIEIKIKNFIIKNFFFKKIYFYFKIIKKAKKRFYYAENSEDVIVNALFDKIKKGVYLDIGCYHPIRGSLTYKLFKKGWKGINVDLSRESIDLFDISRPKDLNLNMAISDKNITTKYFQVGNINQANSLEKINGAKKIQIDSINIDTLIKKFDLKKIDYLNIDAEGADYKIITGFSLKKIRPILITIEDVNNNNFDLKSLLKNKMNNFFYKKNYFLYSRTACTSFYVDIKYKKIIHKVLNTTIDFTFK